MAETYQERIARYRLIRHDELPEEHKAIYRLNGIDPDDTWSLIWSFDRKEDALEQLAHEEANKAHFQTWRLVDAGAAQVVERQAWF